MPNLAPIWLIAHRIVQLNHVSSPRATPCATSSSPSCACIFHVAANAGRLSVPHPLEPCSISHDPSEPWRSSTSQCHTCWADRGVAVALDRRSPMEWCLGEGATAESSPEAETVSTSVDSNRLPPISSLIPSLPCVVFQTGEHFFVRLTTAIALSPCTASPIEPKPPAPTLEHH